MYTGIGVSLLTFYFMNLFFGHILTSESGWAFLPLGFIYLFIITALKGHVFSSYIF